MKNRNDILNALEENKELTTKLIQLWKENGSAADLAKTLKAAGFAVTAAEAEEIIVKLQNKRAEEISKNALDDDSLAKVSGGNWGTNPTSDDCLSMYKKGTDCWVDAACALTFEMPTTTCDMRYECISNNMYTPVDACS